MLFLFFILTLFVLYRLSVRRDKKRGYCYIMPGVLDDGETRKVYLDPNKDPDKPEITITINGKKVDIDSVTS
ncbi:hypothetical protein FACS1894201_06490 [Bacteroidia bacterium]|nr:hypothetical protein FACS1894201_06490 [Bacteroidia bacterium]